LSGFFESTQLSSSEPLPIFARQRFTGGGDFRNFEPVIAAKSLSFSKLDKIIRQLRLSFKENPAAFDVPAFAVKVY
jgi:hypothetical protein